MSNTDDLHSLSHTKWNCKYHIVCVDHVHMLVEIPPKMSISGYVGYIKGKSSQMIYERWANLRYKYRSREFWCRGYYVGNEGLLLHTPGLWESVSDRYNESFLRSIHIFN